MKQLYLRFPEGKPKALTLSYDDANVADRKMVGILDTYGIRCTFNVPTGRLGDPGLLTAEEILTLYAPGRHEIAAHGEGHIAPGMIGLTEAMYDFARDRMTLEAMTGKIIRGMAYPNTGIRVVTNGESKENIKSHLHALGFDYARTLGGDNDGFRLPSDWMEWVPTCHHTNEHLMEYTEKFLSTVPDDCYDRSPLLFYLWGHSFEFALQNNWDLLETFCQTVSGREDIWYATNEEIYRYVTAYRSLVFSSDGDLINNPTAIPLWWNHSKRVGCIQPGETISLRALQ